MFDPTLPAANSPNSSAQMRAQLNGLKDLIDAVSGVTSAQVDAVNTLPAGSPATVAVSVSAGVLHFTFNLPQGNEGVAGPPFTNFVVDNVNQLPPGSWPNASANFDGTAVRFNFGIPLGNEGPQGIQGPQGLPFASAIVDGVTTLNPGDAAYVNSSFDGTNVHFTFAIPRGQDGGSGGPGEQGPQGIQGPPGEVTNAELQAAINGSSANSNAVSSLAFGANPSYDPAQMQDVIAKVNELISALRR